MWFFFTQTHSIIQIRRIVISGICYDFVVCSLVVWFILVKIQVLWIFFCTFWLLVMTLLFLWFVSFFVLSLVSILALLFPPLQSTQFLWIMYNVFLVFVFSICPSSIFILLPCFALQFSCVHFFMFIFIFHWLFCIFLWTFYCHIN